MTSYVDSSAVLKRSSTSPTPTPAGEMLRGVSELVTGRHTLSKFAGTSPECCSGTALTEARRWFATDLGSFGISRARRRYRCELAATIAEQTGVRPLDALHLGGGPSARARPHIHHVRPAPGGTQALSGISHHRLRVSAAGSDVSHQEPSMTYVLCPAWLDDYLERGPELRGRVAADPDIEGRGVEHPVPGYGVPVAPLRRPEGELNVRDSPAPRLIRRKPLSSRTGRDAVPWRWWM